MSEYPRLALGIPTINRKDLLLNALEIYKETWKNREVIIVDNGEQDLTGLPDNFTVINEHVNLGVACSWNRIMEHAKKMHTHVQILNDDVISTKTPECIEKWIFDNFADFYRADGYYSFILPVKTYDFLGGFDENFYPAYYEDTDYERRLDLAALFKKIDSFLLPETLLTSKSGEKDKSLYDKIYMCRRYYIEKWGGEPGKETVTENYYSQQTRNTCK